MTFTEDQLKRLLKSSTPGTAFNHIIRAHLYNIRHWPRCRCCGETDNLTEVIATPMPTGTYHLCPRCLADEEQQS